MVLYGITIVTSAFLLFLVQPIIAKQILPWFGGSAAVWTTCVVFFQALLLAGYAYAHAIGRRTPRSQATIHSGLLVVSLLCLPITASTAWKPIADTDPTGRIVALLFATIGLPYFLLSSTGPLVQKWFANDPRHADQSARVYRLFALSNIGSLVGLLAYPFAVEPYATLAGQSWGWSAGYVVFACACAACAWRLSRRTSTIAAPDATADTGASPGLRHYAYWLACAALGSMLLLAVTNHMTQNVASIPFLWVLPLTLYLLSFVVVFEGRGGAGWYVRRWWMPAVVAATILMAWALSAHQGVLHIYAAIPIFSVGLFLACVFCHGELAAAKPAPAYLTHFYLSLSAGGALGGLFVALFAPRFFTNEWETPIALFGLAVVGLWSARERNLVRWLTGAFTGLIASGFVLLAGGGAPFTAMRDALPTKDSMAWPFVLAGVAVIVFGIATWKRLTMALVVASLVCTGFYGVRYYRFLATDTLHASRNFYGTLRVKDTEPGVWQERRLMHGTILHGDQYTDPAKRKMPTSYYGPGSGIALALRALRPEGTPLDVAMIGLGAGTLTAWGKPGDHYRIYELNPAVEEVARRDFTYLGDTQADVRVILGDARLSMEREVAEGRPMLYDIIAVDAFSSDAIPVHLITREALATYLAHLKPDGVVAFHVSNRFLDLPPVVLQLADDAGLDAVNVVDEPDENEYASSEWVLVTRNEAFLDRDEVLDKSREITPIGDLPIWTDEYNNLFRILK